MKTLLILGAMAFSVTALSIDKNYQYKDITPDTARVYTKKGAPEERQETRVEKTKERKPAKTIEQKIQDSDARKNR